MCYLNRTYHVLLTHHMSAICQIRRCVVETARQPTCSKGPMRKSSLSVQRCHRVLYQGSLTNYPPASETLLGVLGEVFPVTFSRISVESARNEKQDFPASFSRRPNVSVALVTVIRAIRAKRLGGEVHAQQTEILQFAFPQQVRGKGCVDDRNKGVDYGGPVPH